MAIGDKIDQIQQAQDLMLSQFDDKEVIQELLASWCHPFQILEDDLNELLTSSGISYATGSMLDIIGSWMGVERGTLSDEDYRALILTQSVIEVSDGSVNSFYKAMETLTQQSDNYFFEPWPRSLVAVVGGGWNGMLYSQLKKAKAAGPVYSLMLDYNLASFTLTDVVSTDSALKDHTGANYQLDNGSFIDDWDISVVTSSEKSDDGTAMADTIDNTWVPMADVVTRTYNISNGFLVDNEGNFIVDDLGNNIEYREYNHD